VVDGEREHGEQRARHPEGHRRDVDHERAHQRAVAAHEAQALGDRAPDGEGRARRHRTHLAQRQRGEEGDEERPGVDRVGRADAEPGDQQPARARADDRGDLREPEVQRQRGAQPLGTGEPRHHRRPRDVDDGAGPREQPRQHEDEDDRRLLGERDRGEPGDDQHLRELGRQQQPPAIDAVGDRTAQQRRGDQRAELHDAQQPDERRRVREHVHLVRDGDQRRLRAERRERLTEQDEPQIARFAHGGQVDGEARHAQQ
jgi:hypothetical protein